MGAQSPVGDDRRDAGFVRGLKSFPILVWHGACSINLYGTRNVVSHEEVMRAEPRFHMNEKGNGVL
jgi:hypothetical protein